MLPTQLRNVFGLKTKEEKQAEKDEQDMRDLQIVVTRQALKALNEDRTDYFLGILKLAHFSWDCYRAMIQKTIDKDNLEAFRAVMESARPAVDARCRYDLHMDFVGERRTIDSRIVTSADLLKYALMHHATDVSLFLASGVVTDVDSAGYDSLRKGCVIEEDFSLTLGKATEENVFPLPSNFSLALNNDMPEVAKIIAERMLKKANDRLAERRPRYQGGDSCTI